MSDSYVDSTRIPEDLGHETLNKHKAESEEAKPATFPAQETRPVTLSTGGISSVSVKA